jgi:hypothetical protein
LRQRIFILGVAGLTVLLAGLLIGCGGGNNTPASKVVLKSVTPNVIALSNSRQLITISGQNLNLGGTLPTNHITGYIQSGGEKHYLYQSDGSQNLAIVSQDGAEVLQGYVTLDGSDGVNPIAVGTIYTAHVFYDGQEARQPELPLDIQFMPATPYRDPFTP